MKELKNMCRKPKSVISIAMLIILGFIVTIIFISCFTGISIKEIFKINEVLAGSLIAIPVFVTWLINIANDKDRKSMEELDALLKLNEKLENNFQEILKSIQDKTKSIKGISEDIEYLIKSKDKFDKLGGSESIKFPLDIEKLTEKIVNRMDGDLKRTEERYDTGEVINKIIDFILNEDKNKDKKLKTVFDKLTGYYGIDFTLLKKNEEARGGLKYINSDYEFKKCIFDINTIKVYKWLEKCEIETNFNSDTYENTYKEKENIIDVERVKSILEIRNKNKEIFRNEEENRENRKDKWDIFDDRDGKFNVNTYIINENEFEISNINPEINRNELKNSIIEYLGNDSKLKLQNISNEKFIIATSRNYINDEEMDEELRASREWTAWHSISKKVIYDEDIKYYIFAVRTLAEYRTDGNGEQDKCNIIVFKAENMRKYIEEAGKILSKGLKYNFYFYKLKENIK